MRNQKHHSLQRLKHTTSYFFFYKVSAFAVCWDCRDVCCCRQGSKPLSPTPGLSCRPEMKLMKSPPNASGRCACLEDSRGSFQHQFRAMIPYPFWSHRPWIVPTGKDVRANSSWSSCTAFDREKCAKPAEGSQQLSDKLSLCAKPASMSSSNCSLTQKPSPLQGGYDAGAKCTKPSFWTGWAISR